MKKICLFVLSVVALTLSSCNGGGNGVTLVSEKIQGPLGQFFEVVSKDYKAKDGKISIEIKRIKEGFPKPWTEGMEVGYSDGEMEPQFTAEFLDNDGNVISKDQTDLVIDKEELRAVAALGIDETASITFSVSEGATQVKISSTFKVNEKSEDTSISSSMSDDESSSSDISDDDSDESLSSTSGSEDWDALLNSYEQYVDKYISYMKKAVKGDMNALSEYPELLEKAQDLSSKLEGAQGDMSASQWSRYMRITNKMAQAAANMH